LDKNFVFEVDNAQRLDNFLSQKLHQTRSQISNFIKNGFVKVDDKVVTKPGLKLKPNQNVFIFFPEVETLDAKDVDFDVDIIYEDDELLVINKPSGVVVHPAPSVKEATLVDWLKQKGIRLSTISGEERHGIVHRLDKGTSGVMVVAKTNQAHQKLSKQLEDKSMGRYYLAVITPPLKEEITTIDKPIGRNPKNRIKMGIVDGAKEAKTSFLGLSLSKDLKKQLICAKLYTGRTHQIRVHLESISRHIIGDEVYAKGQATSFKERILLHAFVIYFIHPKTNEKLYFKAGLDKEYKKYLEEKFDTEMISEENLYKLIGDKFGDTFI
jgi:23S rRNA pseudouridine1911/1915/1917 synthase